MTNVATTIYKNKAGQRLPSVTTILGLLNKPGLVPWAYNLGLAGKDMEAARDGAADAGTIAHWWAEQDIKAPLPPGSDWKESRPNYVILGGKAPRKVYLSDIDPEVLAKAEGAFEAYRTWKSMTRLELVASEVSLVSEELGFGGTLDAIGKIDGKLLLIDFKTSNGTYWDHLLQIAAYGRLWNENHAPDEHVQGYQLIRFGKEEGDFHQSHFPQLEKAWMCFAHLVPVYSLKKQIDKLAA